MARGLSLAALVHNSTVRKPLNKRFLTDVMNAIEALELKNRRKSSNFYKPSSMNCEREMYFTRMGAPEDYIASQYNGIGMADTGTRRHVAIQEVLESMEKNGFDWRYIDVAKYLDQKHKEGKCLDVIATDKRGMETHLKHNKLFLSFMCDGIVQQISTGDYFLFEFKNQISFKYANKQKVDDEHISQVATYCMALDLDKALVLYENRDNCELECPELLSVSQEIKDYQIQKLLYVEDCVHKQKAPKRQASAKRCRYCKYKTICEKVGD